MWRAFLNAIEQNKWRSLSTEMKCWIEMNWFHIPLEIIYKNKCNWSLNFEKLTHVSIFRYENNRDIKIPAHPGPSWTSTTSITGHFLGSLVEQEVIHITCAVFKGCPFNLYNTCQTVGIIIGGQTIGADHREADQKKKRIGVHR